jgi:hypothetical protein
MMQPTLPTPTAIGSDAVAGPLSIRVEDAIVADGTATVSSTNAQNDAPPSGLAYVLARLTVTNTGEQAWSVAASDFIATGTDGVLRRCPSIALPDPALDRLLEPGETVAGWTASLVNDTSSVVLIFDPAIAAGERFTATFALTDGASIPSFDIASDAGDAGTSLSAPAGIGTTVRTALWEVSVNETIGSGTFFEISDYRVQALGPPSSDGDGWQAVGMELTIRNINEAPQFFSWSALELVDLEGEPWYHLLAMTQPHPPVSVELLPGAAVTGWYGIWLQPWASTRLLRLRDSVLSGDERYISLDGTSGSTAAAEQREPLDLAPGDTAAVGADALNLRDDASASGAIVAELDPGTDLVVTGEPVEGGGYRWYPVEVVETGEAGFVAEDFLSATSD